ncbi:MAG TPA: hypothetical protein VFA03_06505 [Acetobacteraceae bacterium]|nr:hypothetical protein [Acetobacteraceae bacterium]
MIAELRSRAEKLEHELAEVRQSAEARIVRAELKAEAVRAGIIDPDGLKLLDLSAAKLDEDGQVANAAALISALKKSKPWLFQSGARTSSTAASAPPAQQPRPRLATEMSDEEWRAAREAILRRQS